MKEIFELIYGMAPYLILGFFLAGLMHAFVPNTLYRRYVGQNSFRSVFNAAMLGIPLPLCSCGVIPTAMSLRKEGASKGATISFLIATPQTGIDSIIATYSLIGFPFALVRPIVALATALFGGCLVNKLDSTLDEKTTTETKTPTGCTSHRSFREKLKTALHYAFVEMMQDIGKWLVVGLIIAGLITVFVPDSFFAIFTDKPLFSMLLVLAFAIPMYLCATGSIPIAVALMMKGLSPGTALVLLMAGPAVNAASILVISKVMGKETLKLYLTSIILGAICFGLGIDYLLPREWFTAPLAQMQSYHQEGINYLHLGSFILLTLLLINAFIQRYRTSSTCSCHAHHNTCNSEKEIEEGCLTITVKGMTCNHCKSNVEKAILHIEKVTQVEANLTNGQVVVYGKTTPEAIKDAVESIGFEVE
ncbi:permease [gut metagenome]|uniref:Permease n=1 Tax=gut metagenome TaxID=749906 RepID=J9G0Y0_9ZZZZ